MTHRTHNFQGTEDAGENTTANGTPFIYRSQYADFTIYIEPTSFTGTVHFEAIGQLSELDDANWYPISLYKTDALADDPVSSVGFSASSQKTSYTNTLRTLYGLRMRVTRTDGSVYVYGAYSSAGH